MGWGNQRVNAPASALAVEDLVQYPQQGVPELRLAHLGLVVSYEQLAPACLPVRLGNAQRPSSHWTPLNIVITKPWNYVTAVQSWCDALRRGEGLFTARFGPPIATENCLTTAHSSCSTSVDPFTAPIPGSR